MVSLGSFYLVVALSMLITGIIDLFSSWPTGWKAWGAVLAQLAMAAYYFYLWYVSRTPSFAPVDVPEVEENDSENETAVAVTPTPNRTKVPVVLVDVPPREVAYTLDDLRKKIDSPEWMAGLEKSIEAWKVFKLKRYDELIAEADRTAPSRKSMDTMGLKADLSLSDALRGARKAVEKISPSRKAARFPSLLTGKDGLESIIGRKDVISEILSTVFAFAASPRFAEKSFPHLALLGHSGSGKTKLASVIARVYSHMGLLATSTVTFVTRSDLVAEFIGQTGPRTRHILYTTLEGILFLDEAYALGGGAGLDGGFKDYGYESVAEIVNFLDKTTGCSMMIVAGYPEKMQENFFGLNEGLRRRFPTRILLGQFTPRELTLITLRDLTFTPTQKEADWLFGVIRKLEARHLLTGQAGDAVELASALSRSRTLGEGEKSLHMGMNDFLRSRGIAVSEVEKVIDSVKRARVRRANRQLPRSKSRTTRLPLGDLVDGGISSGTVTGEDNVVPSTTPSADSVEIHGGDHRDVLNTQSSP